MDLLANLLHHGAAEIADPFLVREAVFNHFCGCSFRNDIRHTAGLALAFMGLHSNLFRCSGLRAVRIGLGFIEVQSQLVHEAVLHPLGRRAKLTLLCKTQLLQKPLVLELQLIVFRA